MNITKRIKTIGISSLAVTMIASMSMVAFASSTSSKVEPTKKSEMATTVKPDQISVSKNGEYIEIKKTTTENLDNVSKIKTEPAKVVENK